MRTPLLAALLGLSLIGCVGVIDSSGGPGPRPGPAGDDMPPPGDDQPPPVTPIPKLDSAIDKTTIDTELGTTHTFQITLTASGDFDGTVMVAPSAVDGAMAPLAGWTVTVDQPSVTMPKNGTATVVGTLKIPSENKGLVGTVKFDLTSSLAAQSLSAAVTAANQVSLIMKTNAGNGQCEYPSSGIAQALTVSTGTKIRFLNTSTDTLTVHVNGGGTGAQHQPDPGSAPNTAYVQTPNNAGTIEWYCHNTGPDLNAGNPRIVVQ